ncbi:hypothetical protein CkaCkLH20_10125 [Colletotrichum karsti]|uniref:DUF3176 domain containing protein n=1 Tax=Colletotrichum karsti TaxID=1095194 RepID=A0A9P6HWU0_9PEZI|nr:uncharacterized protein CkaCkLH20_10125 [Colletotrichum karsti]KAF9872298.1 hypothetical protein CkaCkLH20_10125 [Colletotrichum karsti]
MAHDAPHRSQSRNSDDVSLASIPAPTPGIASVAAIRRKPLNRPSPTDVPDDANPRSPSLKTTSNIGYTNIRGSDKPSEKEAAPKRPPVMRYWSLELASLALAIGLMAAMLGILIRADGRPTSDWSFPININSLIAILSTIYRALLLGIATEVISQFKWVWFWSKSSPARPLSHFSDFDDASRGIWGALKLCRVVATHSVSSLLALIVIILSFAAGPFIQQSINVITRTDQLPERRASLPVSYMVDGGDLWYRSSMSGVMAEWNFRPHVRGLVYSALFNPGSNDTSIAAECSTGNCTFSAQHSAVEVPSSAGDVTHASIGVCSYCSDLSSLVTAVNDTHVGLPNGMAVSIINPDAMQIKNDDDLSWAEGIIDDQKISQIIWAFANITILTRGVPDDTDPKNLKYADPTAYSAVSCSLVPCLKSYSAAITNGKLTETVVETMPMYPDGIDYPESDPYTFSSAASPLPQVVWNITAVQSPCRVNGSVFDIIKENQNSSITDTKVRILSPSNGPDYLPQMVPGSCTFRMSGFIYRMFSQLYQNEIFSGSCSWDRRQGDAVDCRSKWWLGLLWEQNNATVESLTTRFSDFAESMTNQFRSGLARQEGTESRVYGRALMDLTYIQIQWPWLILPAVLLVIDIISFGWVILRGLRHRKDEVVWKSHSLPLLFYKELFVTSEGARIEQGDLTGISDAADGRLMTTSEMEAVSKKVKVKLLRGGTSGASSVEVASRTASLRQRSLLEQPSDNDTLLGRV